AASAGAIGVHCFRRTSAASSPRTIASSRNSSPSATSANGRSSPPGPPLTRVERAITSVRCRPPTSTTSLPAAPGTRTCADPGHLRSEGALDRECVWGWRDGLGGRAHSARALFGAGVGDAEALLLLRPLAIGVARDGPIPLEPLQCRVHLADIQRPHLAGPR